MTAAAPRRRMCAALLTECGQPLRIVDDVEIDAPRPGEALVRITHLGVCHSDLTVIDGPSPFRMPVVMGHEAAGVIEELGTPGGALRPGDRVVLSMRAPCDACFYCERGQPVLCEASSVAPGKGEIRLWWRGRPVSRGMNLGAFAEYALVSLRGLASVPPGLPMDQASICGCAVQTAMGSVINVGDCDSATRACVIGLGGVGLATVMALTSIGAQAICGIDPVGARRARARELGARLVLAPDEVADNPDLAAMTQGRGFDTVFDNVASTATTNMGLSLTRGGGELILIGVTGAPQPPGFSTMDLVMRQKRVTGAFLGNSHVGREMGQILEAAEQGALPLDRLITAVMPFERINDALALMRANEGVRTVLRLDAPEGTGPAAAGQGNRIGAGHA